MLKYAEKMHNNSLVRTQITLALRLLRTASTLYTNMRYIVILVILVFSSLSTASEIDRKYREILFKYSEAALSEFWFVSNSKSSEIVKYENATFTVGKDKIGRKFYVVLFPVEDGSYYVSLELNKDGFLEIHGRGSISPTPKEFYENFERHIDRVVHYPGPT